MKMKLPSTLDDNRRQDKHQVEERRKAILDAAEAVFLENGLEQTSMVDIAVKAGINKVTLYRYFPNRDEIALEIHARMLNRIIERADLGSLAFSAVTVRNLAHQMIIHFEDLRDTYRFMAMFDILYLDRPAETGIPQRTKAWLAALRWEDSSLQDLADGSVEGSRNIMVLSTVIWFLEKLALRGELTWSDQSVPIEVHLQLFEEMIMSYIDRFLDLP